MYLQVHYAHTVTSVPYEVLALVKGAPLHGGLSYVNGMRITKEEETAAKPLQPEGMRKNHAIEMMLGNRKRCRRRRRQIQFQLDVNGGNSGTRGRDSHTRPPYSTREEDSH